MAFRGKNSVAIDGQPAENHGEKGEKVHREAAIWEISDNITRM